MRFIELINDADIERIYVNPDYIVSMVFNEDTNRTELTTLNQSTWYGIVDTPDEIITKIKELHLREALGII